MLPIHLRVASSRPRRRGWGRAAAAIGLVLAIAASVAACADNADNLKASPTPADFLGTVSEFARVGIGVDRPVSGDAGCPDPTLTPTAIGFDAKGLDQTTVVRIHLYLFKDKSTFDRRRSSVDTCARSYVTDPATYQAVDAPPFVATGQGPWAPQFEAAVRQALSTAAGSAN